MDTSNSTTNNVRHSNKRLDETKYHATAEAHGITWISSELPRNANTRTQWRCANGHEWLSTYASIYSGYGCPRCAKNARKTADDYRKVGEPFGIEWLAEEIPSAVGKKTLWKCSFGHTWLARYSTIRIGFGCPHCAGIARKQIEDYHSLASTHGLEWIGDALPRNTKTRTLWRCKNGHTFYSLYNSIDSMDCGCPICADMLNGARVSKPQRKLHAMIGGELNHRFGKYIIDVAIERNNLKIAVEYDAWHWHDPAHDLKRDSYLIKRGWRVLRIKSGEAVPDMESFEQAITQILDGAITAELVLSDWRGNK